MDRRLAALQVSWSWGGAALGEHRESKTGQSDGKNQFGSDGHRKISLECVGFVANKGI